MGGGIRKDGMERQKAPERRQKNKDPAVWGRGKSKGKPEIPRPLQLGFFPSAPCPAILTAFLVINAEMICGGESPSVQVDQDRCVCV
jgi:hypothetical protein